MFVRPAHTAHTKTTASTQFQQNTTPLCHTSGSRRISNYQSTRLQHSTPAWKHSTSKLTHASQFTHSFLLQQSDILSTARSNTAFLGINPLTTQHSLSHIQAQPFIRSRYVHHRSTAPSAAVVASAPATPLAFGVVAAAETNMSKTVQPSETKVQLKELLKNYADLVKIRLSTMVLLSTAFVYVVAPAPFSFATCAVTSIGTFLAICSANAFNEYIEADRDKKMNRTTRRPLPAGRMTMQHAFNFGIATGVSGVALLTTINPLAAALAFSNIFIYTCIYTPLKIRHPINTHVGGIVGLVPPLIGWAAATGTLGAGAWVMGSLLFVWQLVHFPALSWKLRNDYPKAGYKMHCTVAPEKVPGIILRWAIALFPFGALCAMSGITTWAFAFDAALLAAWVMKPVLDFYRQPNDTNAHEIHKVVTRYYLPLFFTLMSFHSTKFGIDTAIWSSLTSLLH